MKLVFIIGTGRCGSTFVHEILARHKDIGFISNVEDNLPFINNLGRWNNFIYRSPIGSFTKKGGIRFAPSEAYSLIGREVSPIYAYSYRDLMSQDVTPWLESRFKDFFGRRFIVQGKPVFSHKYTGWPRIRFFSQRFPDARFIHIVRDGRAVANSWLQMDWWCGYRGPENWLWGPLPPALHDEWMVSGGNFPVLAALSWKLLINAFEESESILGSKRYMRLRYEDILSEPEEHFRNMLEFCGLEWTGDFRHILSRQQILKDRSRAFERDLTPSQVISIETVLGPLLERYGYA